MTHLRTTVLALILVLAGALLTAPTAVAAQVGNVARPLPHRQVFLLLSTDTSRRERTLAVALGTIHDRGRDVVIGPRLDRLIFSDGNVVLRHKPRKSSRHQSFDPDTCLFRFVERGTWRVARGTETYSDATGHGKYRVRGYGISCDEERPELFSLKVRAVGKLRL